MCGIAGFIDTKASMANNALEVVVNRMTGAIKHRGPDDNGVWVDQKFGVALGHRRLSIIDLSDKGRQPMVSHSGRYVIIYNGEIYNFGQLRKELTDRGGEIGWRGHSDTEILLESLDRIGVDRTLKLANGMFAFAMWDRTEKRLTLARDRLGKKPLYYGVMGDSFLFASELKAVCRHPSFSGRIDSTALGYLMRHNYIPSPYSIFKGIYKLNPGCSLALGLDSVCGNDGFSPWPDNGVLTTARPISFWSAEQVIQDGSANTENRDEQEASERLEELLSDAVKLRMVADVPLGAFLSGGVDSSVVVSLMQKQSLNPVRTYSIGYHDDPRSEAILAKEISRRLGTDHTELYVTPREVMDVIPQLPRLSDEPLGDVALIPTYIVSKLARRDVKVCLTGDGGDELFAGYPRYLWAHWYSDEWLKKVGWIPNSARKIISGLINTVGAERLGSLLGVLKPGMTNPKEKLGELAYMLPTIEPEGIYRDLNFHWEQPRQVVHGWKEGRTVYSESPRRSVTPDYVQGMVSFDLSSRLPDSLLAKVDRVTMAVSLEARCPIIDYRLVEFSTRLPTSLKIRERLGKYLLRKVLYKYVSEDLVHRPKKGFSMPIKVWLRGGLRDWAEALLDERRLREEGYFNPAPIRKKLEEHMSGKGDWHYHLWDALMFQAWLEGVTDETSSVIND